MRRLSYTLSTISITMSICSMLQSGLITDILDTLEYSSSKYRAKEVHRYYMKTENGNLLEITTTDKKIKDKSDLTIRGINSHYSIKCKGKDIPELVENF